MTLHIGEMPKQHRMGGRGVQGYLFGRPSMSIPTQVPDLIAEPQQQAA
ncbi:MAG TPA: hypothetical protein VKB76_04345 [Ktedonobacterales bacterium]|nr:hypothetical protein [Ktedonobacterales bacterium]